ncbi:hypothetical protein KOEU_34120 [Komagataeibacter europaeus]|uniref:Uncharacterized protein n=1 Tax=Komagataeibacter europaeus TaxID=33995 RepID=A0A0M0EDT3_KOMEU|nr:hypothetical protein KOEU_34120 [Komagataeibacter europaeus]
MAGHEAGWFGFCRDVRDCIYRISSFHRQCLVNIFENRRIQKLLFFVIQLLQGISGRFSLRLSITPCGQHYYHKKFGVLAA